MLNILKSFSDFYSRDTANVHASKAVSTPSIEGLANHHLYQDIATEEFYVLIAQPGGSEKRMYLNEEQLKAMVS